MVSLIKTRQDEPMRLHANLSALAEGEPGLPRHEVSQARGKVRKDDNEIDRRE
jgi:hypothetical protein